MTRNTKNTLVKNEWRTPPWLLYYAQMQIGGLFDLDACATSENKICHAYLSDCLTQPWLGERVWCNPPYSPTALRRRIFNRGVDQVRKGIARSVTFLMGPADPSTDFVHNVNKVAQVTMLHPRVKFLHPNGAPSNAPGIGVYLAYIDRSTLEDGGAGGLDYRTVKDLQDSYINEYKPTLPSRMVCKTQEQAAKSSPS